MLGNLGVRCEPPAGVGGTTRVPSAVHLWSLLLLTFRMAPLPPMLLQPASLLRIPILPAASSASTTTGSNSSNGTLAAPWSLMATVDHLALSCAGAASVVASTPANATLAPSTLPSALLTAFRSGLRNLTMQVSEGEGDGEGARALL